MRYTILRLAVLIGCALSPVFGDVITFKYSGNGAGAFNGDAGTISVEQIETYDAPPNGQSSVSSDNVACRGIFYAVSIGGLAAIAFWGFRRSGEPQDPPACEQSVLADWAYGIEAAACSSGEEKDRFSLSAH